MDVFMLLKAFCIILRRYIIKFSQHLLLLCNACVSHGVVGTQVGIRKEKNHEALLLKT